MLVQTLVGNIAGAKKEMRKLRPEDRKKALHVLMTNEENDNTMRE